MGWEALQFMRPALIRTASFGAVESPICSCEMSSCGETPVIECSWFLVPVLVGGTNGHQHQRATTQNRARFVRRRFPGGSLPSGGHAKAAEPRTVCIH